MNRESGPEALSTRPADPQPRPRLRLLVLGSVLTVGLVAAGAVAADWNRGWRSEASDSRFERRARFERFCANDTARYHPVLRAFVQADLRLDAGQRAQFDRLADLVLPGLEDLKREVCNDFVARGGPAPDRVAHLAAVLRKAADMAERAVEPSRQFYASLNEEQKQRVEELTNRRRFGPR